MMNSFFSRTTHLLTKVAGFAVGVVVVSSVVNASTYTERMGERAVIFHPFGGRTDNTIVGEKELISAFHGFQSPLYSIFVFDLTLSVLFPILRIVKR